MGGGGGEEIVGELVEGVVEAIWEEGEGGEGEGEGEEEREVVEGQEVDHRMHHVQHHIMYNARWKCSRSGL